MSISRLHWLAFAAAIVVGCAIGYIDTRPTWDDSGVSAGAILMTSALLAAVAPTRAWIVALLVGIPVVAFDVVSSGNYGSVIALVVAFIGAALGAALRKMSTPRAST